MHTIQNDKNNRKTMAEGRERFHANTLKEEEGKEGSARSTAVSTVEPASEKVVLC